MRERCSSADTVKAALDHLPLILCDSAKPMDRTRNGARYFRNPPQPHMCIQDYIEGCDQICFINVLSWVKISTPRRPEDPIPLYGGLRVPHTGSAAFTVTNKIAKHQPVIFAVMANPEILRLSGKTAQDPSDRDALVELMLDFVEAMNPDVKFKRQFQVLRDRDLAGELKDIWLAVQIKRERERGENGKRSDYDRGRENKEEYCWRGEDKHRKINFEKSEQGVSSVYDQQECPRVRKEKHANPSLSDESLKVQNVLEQDHRALKHVRLKKQESAETSRFRPPCEEEEITQTPSALNCSSTIPSTETSSADIKEHHGSTHISSESGHQPRNSWNNQIILSCDQIAQDLIAPQLTNTCVPAIIAESSKVTGNDLCFSLYSPYSCNEQMLGGLTGTKGHETDEVCDVKHKHDYTMDHSYGFKQINACCEQECSAKIDPHSGLKKPHVENIEKDSKIDKSKEISFTSEHYVIKPIEANLTSKHSYHVMKSNLKNTTITAGDRNILSSYSESRRDNSEASVPNQIDNSPEEVLPNANDNMIVKFTIGAGKEEITIP